MKERQRWQPEEDALLRAYVKQFGPKEWNLISSRMGTTLDRDPKSCLERWKNYLKPGIKKGSLTPEEQTLVISLQEKYGNKWKKIAAEVPGRTAKRLGKWWEVYKEKQQKQIQKSQKGQHQYNQDSSSSAAVASPETAAQGKYDHILETFAEKYVQPVVQPVFAMAEPVPVQHIPVLPNPTIPPWMINMNATPSNSITSSSAASTTPSPSVSLTLSPSEPDRLNPFPNPVQDLGILVQHCKEVEEGKESWMRQKKEATWRLNRLEQQLEAEKARRRKEITEEIEAKIRRLREEEAAYLSRMEGEYREQVKALEREAEAKEGKLMEAWSGKHVKMMKLVQQIGGNGNGWIPIPTAPPAPAPPRGL